MTLKSGLPSKDSTSWRTITAGPRRCTPNWSAWAVQYLSTGKLSDGKITSFRNAVRSLVSMYKEHISVEDNLIFPLARRVLSDTEKLAIANEMAGRRQVELVTNLS